MTPNEFQKKTNVSRETMERLKLYEQLLIKWTSKINLIGSTTINSIWEKHFLESLEFSPYLGMDDIVADIGTGAGFPGMILAICGMENIHLIESDERKCQFLYQVKRELEVNVLIEKKRIEAHSKTNYDRVISRACAPLNKLCAFGTQLLDQNGKCVFIKGKNVLREIEEAQKNWTFQYELHPGRYNKESSLIVLRHLNQKDI